MSTEVDQGGGVSVFHGKSSPVFQATSGSYAKKVALHPPQEAWGQ